MIKFEHNGDTYLMIPANYSYDVSNGNIITHLTPKYPPPDFYTLIRNPSMFEHIMQGKDSFSDVVRGNAQNGHHLIYKYVNPFL